MPFRIRAWLLQAKGVLLWGAFFGFFCCMRLAHDNAIHCHPTFENIPVTPLDRRSMRIDRTKDQKSFHVATFFTVAFLLPCLAASNSLAHNLKLPPGTTSFCADLECRSYQCTPHRDMCAMKLCCCTNHHGFTSQRVRQLTYNIPFPKVVAL